MFDTVSKNAFPKRKGLTFDVGLQPQRSGGDVDPEQMEKLADELSNPSGGSSPNAQVPFANKPQSELPVSQLAQPQDQAAGAVWYLPTTDIKQMGLAGQSNKGGNNENILLTGKLKASEDFGFFYRSPEAPKATFLKQPAFGLSMPSYTTYSIPTIQL